MVAASSKPHFLEALHIAQQRSRLIELRIDTIAHIATSDLHDISRALHPDVQAVVTCRSALHGGAFSGSIIEQNQLLQTANDLGFHYLDVDVDVADAIKIERRQSQIILSHHNFAYTPSDTALEVLKTRMLHFDPDVIKIATRCHSQNDVRRLLKFLLNKKNNEQMIVLGMGPEGKLTRLLAPFLGGMLTFAPQGACDADLGHIALSDLNNFFEIMKSILGEHTP